MRISRPEISVVNGEMVVSAQVSFDQPLLNKPDRLWFSVPEKFASFISQRSDAFAVGMLALAMHIGEDLTIEGELSPRLLRGMAEYQQAFHFWFPQMSVIKNDASCLSKIDPLLAGKETISLFSGGVDLTYTLMQHLPGKRPIQDFQIKYGLFIHGFDIPLQNQPSFENAFNTLSRELAVLDIGLIPLRSNLRYFTSGLIPWSIAHGSAHIAAGLTLDRQCSHLLVPASHFVDDFKPWGSSPLVDHWLSTEFIEVIHHGINASRMDKIQAISAWQPAQSFLRVCINEKGRDGVQNCTRCEKCMRTMAMLELFGTLEKFKTFPRYFGVWDIARWTPHYGTSVVFTPSMIKICPADRKNKISVSIIHCPPAGITHVCDSEICASKII